MRRDKQTEEIMRKVRERIRRRGYYIPDQPKDELDVTPLNKDIKNLITKADTRSERIITSHRKIVGHSLVRIRRFLHKEIARAAWPTTSKQIDFNRSVAHALFTLQKRIERIEAANRKLRKKR